MNEDTWNSLMERAIDVRQHAHAPYSRYAVGAALLAADGSVYEAVNVENASYGLTICAERAAVFAAVAAGQTRFKALAIVCSGGQPPCGACRQVLAEFCDDLPIVLVDADRAGGQRETSLAELLPHRFGRE
jgi:cytidine deaminase